MIKRRLYLACLLPIMMGAGPCDVAEMSEEESSVDGGDTCTQTACIEEVSVAVVKADNTPFSDGAYAFAGLYPNGAYVESYCYYDTVNAYLECENSGMTAMMEGQGRKVTLTFQGAPDWLRVGVAFNEITVGDVQIEPTYLESDTEDAACPTLCRNAQEIISVDSL